MSQIKRNKEGPLGFIVKTLSLSILLLAGCECGPAFADEAEEYSPTKISQMMDKGSLALEKAPVPLSPQGLTYADLPPDMAKKITESQQKNFPKFKECMWFYHYAKTKTRMYSVFYNWLDNRCVLGVEKIDSKTGLPGPNDADKKGTTIDMRHCEKLYLFNAS